MQIVVGFCVLVWLSLGTPVYGQPSAAAPFFVGLQSGTTAADLMRTDVSVRSQRAVGLRLDRVFDGERPAERVLLNMGDAAWIAVNERLDRDPIGFRSWVGAIEGIENSHVVITERGGVVSGLVNALSEQYRIRTLVPGTYLLEQIDSSNLDIGRRDDVLVPEGNEPVAEHHARRLAATASDSADGIDVLMVYTPAARSRFGIAQLQAIAAQVISDTNTAFARSSANARFRSVGLVEIPLAETVNMETDLRALSTGLGPGLRAQYRADLVQLLEVTQDSRYCGIAWILTTQNAVDFSSAFSVSDIGRSGCIAQYTSAHEFGHNLGSAHDLAHASGPRLYDYSLGYQDAGRGFRTVMAYPCAGWCPAIANFSNPSVSHAGGATGTANANNALSMNNIAQHTANWRLSTPAGPPDPPIALQAVVGVSGVSLQWTAASSGGIATGFLVQVGRLPGGSDLFSGAVGGLPTVSGVVPPGTYYWRVAATNDFGTSAPAAEAQFTIVAPAAPTPPTSLFSTVNGNTVTLSWSGATGTPPPSNYIVQVGTAPGVYNVFNGGVGNRTFVTSPVPSGTYFWRVLAANAVGLSSPSVERQFSAGCAVAPGAARDLFVSVSGRVVTLSWSPPLAGGPPEGYIIEAGSAAGLSNLVVFPTGNSTFLTTSAPPGTFFVRVKAQNGCGVGGASNERVIVVP